MQSCTSCGRQILPAARFCTECGMPAGQAGAGAAPDGRPAGRGGGPPAAQAGGWPEGWAEARPGEAPVPGDVSPGDADPFDYLYARPRPHWPGGAQQPWRPSPAQAWPRTDRISAGDLPGPGQPPGVPRAPGAPPGRGAPPGHAAGSGHGARRHGRFGPLPIAAVLALAVAVGVATAIYLRGAAQQSATAANGQPIGSGGRTGAVAVVIGPAAASRPGARTAARLVAAYFAAINRHDFAVYQKLLAPASRQALTRRAFSSGYASTRDTRVTLRALRTGPHGDRAASVTFISHQRAADSPARASCTRWHVTLFLEPSGSGYLIGPAPASYHAAYRRCR